jgi:hypothetical protein
VIDRLWRFLDASFDQEENLDNRSSKGETEIIGGRK